MKKIILILIWIFFLSCISAAQWVDDFNDCPNNYAGDDCLVAGELACGYYSSTLYCSDPSEIIAPSVNDTTNAGDTYQSSFAGGYIIDCLAYDSTDPFCSNGNGNIYWCNRNVTCYSIQYRQTRCVQDLWASDSGGSECQSCKSERYNCFGNINCEATSTSNCNASTIPNTRYNTATCFTNLTEIPIGYSTCICDPNYFECDGGIDDNDGCEHLAGATCESDTGYKVNDQCFDLSNANCTATGNRADNRDCNDGDGDGNQITCNDGSPDDGCEITLFVDTNNSNSEYQTCTTFECVNAGTLNGWLDCDSGAADPDGGDGLDANGCEVQNNSVCSTGGLTGTINMCSGGSGNCLVDPVDYGTSGTEYKWSGSTTFLRFVQLGSGYLMNLTGKNNESFTVDTNTNVGFAGNLTMGNMITFTLGNIIQAISATWVKVSTSLWVDGDLNVTGTGTFENITLRDNNICNETACFTLQDLNTTGGGGMDYTNVSMLNESQTFAEEVNFTKEVGFHDDVIIWFD